MGDPRSSQKTLQSEEKRATDTFAKRIKAQAEQEGKPMTDRQIMEVVRETAETVERKQISAFYKGRK